MISRLIALYRNNFIVREKYSNPQKRYSWLVTKEKKIQPKKKKKKGIAQVHLYTSAKEKTLHIAVPFLGYGLVCVLTGQCLNNDDESAFLLCPGLFLHVINLTFSSLNLNSYERIFLVARARLAVAFTVNM